jgi:hypothetical protein
LPARLWSRIDRVEQLWQGPPSWNILALNGSHGTAIVVYIRDGVRDTDEAE